MLQPLNVRIRYWDLKRKCQKKSSTHSTSTNHRKRMCSKSGMENQPSIPPNDLHSFVGVFCGYPIDKIQQLCESVESFEKIWKSKYNLKPDQELKSINIRKNNFEYCLASLKGNNKKFYGDLISLIIELNPIISISFSNKSRSFSVRLSGTFG